jgi:sugar/nucleoside kinase (ribokinase family)
VVVVDETHRTRNIFYDTQQVLGADPQLPEKTVILSARVLLVDRFGLPGMIRAARLAQAAGIHVVADFEGGTRTHLQELLELCDHLILPERFACHLTGAATAAAATLKLWRKDRVVVICTCGAQGCWVLASPGRVPRHLPAFRVKAVDTTGCGDVFHGAYAAALARGMEVTDRVFFASAAAALKATQRGGQAGIPTLQKVQSFLKQSRRNGHR